MTASDKLFFWLFQNQPDRILQLLPDLPADAGGYRFVAPVFKAPLAGGSALPAAIDGLWRSGTGG